MAEGITRQGYESAHDITIEAAKRLPADDGEFDELVLVRNDFGWWGTAIHCYGEECPVEYEDVEWFIDEATARRDFAQEPSLSLINCDACDRSMDAEAAMSPKSTERELVVCPLCWARADAEGDHV